MLHYSVSEWRRNAQGYLEIDLLCCLCNAIVAPNIECRPKGGHFGLRDELILSHPAVRFLNISGQQKSVLCPRCQERTIMGYFSDALAEDWYKKVIEPLGCGWEGKFFGDKNRNHTGVYGISYELRAIWLGWIFDPHFRSFWKLFHEMNIEGFTGKVPFPTAPRNKLVLDYILSLKPSTEEMEKHYA
jgi:uncharacterized Zn-finger protein